jgi:NOL1/NOP2/fmu family ribosome biogenesis protein
MKILSKKETKKILELIKEQFDVDYKFEDIVLMNKEKIYLLSMDYKDVDVKIKINSLGLYFGKLQNEKLRLSIEGSQLIKGKKNIIEIKDNGVKKWLMGETLSTEEDLKGFVIIKNKGDYYGCGEVKEGRILNYISKDRRIR